LEYKHHSASEHNLNYTQLHGRNQFQLNTPSQKAKVGRSGTKLLLGRLTLEGPVGCHSNRHKIRLFACRIAAGRTYYPTCSKKSGRFSTELSPDDHKHKSGYAKKRGCFPQYRRRMSLK